MEIVTGVVTGALGSVVSKLGEFLKDEYNLQAGVREKITSLSRELESMHAALCKVAEVPPDELDKQVKIWARDVRELSYTMEDILDDSLVRLQAGRKRKDPDMKWYQLAANKIVEVFSQAKSRREISCMIDIINEKAMEVAKRRARYTVDSIVAHPSRTVDPRLTAMYRKASEIIGIQNSSADLISMLLPKEEDESASVKKMKIVSVVGVGGLGKTTLAKAVFDKLISKFDCGAFVPVGQHPSVTKVLRDILIDIDKHKYTDLKYTMLDERQLINELRDFLGAKRYLVVIDDIWDLNHLDTMKSALVENGCGSRIIITTRKFGVAKGADDVYELQPLSYDNSKELFCTRFFDGEGKCPTNHVVELSDRILKKCGGVPLAIITMASFLLDKKREEWIEVCDSGGFYQDKDDRHLENTMHILSLSYNDLPCHLKACLLYLSVFPEDYLIYKDSLVWMWIAEGFITKKPGRGSFEVGEEYFHELINRSLIQGVDFKANGIMDGCHVHDMVLDLIISKSREENLFVSDDGTLSQCQSRRLFLKNRKLDLSQDRHVNMPQVRTFVAWQCGINKWALHPRLKHIRVLSLESCSFREGCNNLEHIENLLHLRYLGIRYSRLEELPEGIGELKFLQTLNLEIFGPLELPCSIGKLKQLVCLRLRAQDREVTIPDGVIGRLTSLEELQIGGPRDNDESKRQFVQDLGNLRELRVLNIATFNDMDENVQIDFLQSIDNLKKMQHLKLEESFILHVNMDPWDAALPSRDLQCLFLPHVWFPRLPSWISSAHLPSLSHLAVCMDYIDEESFKALSRLPELRYLSLSSRGQNTCTTEPDGCFPNLRSLVLPSSMVQFVANGDSSVSFISCGIYYGMVNGSRRKDNRRVVPAGLMPNLEELEFRVGVQGRIEKEEAALRRVQQIGFSCDNLGLEYLPSLRRVKVYFDCEDAFEDDVEREEAALRHAIDVHPNRPALQIRHCFKDRMKRRSDHEASVQPPNTKDEEETQS